MTGAVLLDGTPPKRLVLDDRPIGTGGQATVHAVAGAPDIVVKLYHEPTPDIERRLECMLVLAHPDQFLSEDGSNHPVLAWPAELVRDVDGAHVTGYTMRRVGAPDYVPLGTLFNPAQRRQHFGDISWRFLVDVARNLAGVVDTLEQREIVLGDVSHSNVVLNEHGYLCFLDCDSIQFTDPRSGELFPCRYLTAEYAAPELQRDGDALRTPKTDDFSVAVLVCRLLLVGDHPFMGVRLDADEDDDADIGRNIQEGCSYLVRPEDMGTPPGTFDVGLLPPPIHALARRAFGPGHDDPAARPAAAEWLARLDEASAAIRRCSVNRYHAYGDHLDTCPWCARMRQGYRDPFPAPAGAASPPPTPDHAPTPGPPGARVPAGKVVLLLLALAILIGVVVALAAAGGGSDYSGY